jgi:hypothetical protein
MLVQFLLVQLHELLRLLMGKKKVCEKVETGESLSSFLVNSVPQVDHRLAIASSVIGTV